MNKYFLKPIKNLVNYTKVIKDKSKKKTKINILKKRDDEIGVLSESLDDMTYNLQKRIDRPETRSFGSKHYLRY